MASIPARASFVSALRRREVSEPVGGAGAAAGFVPGCVAGADGCVPEVGSPAGRALRGGAGGGGASAPGFEAPPERRAADRVMRRDPHPGQVTMESGLESGPIGVLQRGQFMSRGPVERRPGGRV